MFRITKIYEVLYSLAFLVYTILIKVRSITRPLISYPKIINFPVTNKCNYRCIMCNVWKPEHSSGKDMKPHEIKQIFSQKLFKNVRHVGVSGGEPFLRNDLLEVIKAITEELPKIKSISIITNASLPGTLLKSKEIKAYLDENDINFSLEVSIDGIGSIHDLNRGVEGAFNRTYDNFEILNKEGLVTSISTTITKKNVHALYETLNFAKKHQIQIDFRLASCIDRLFIEDKITNFQFSELEKLIIIKFLDNLISNYEKRLWKKIFYMSLIGQLSGEKRMSGCENNTSSGMSLDPYGNVYFCFPKSPKLYNALEEQSDINNLKKFQPILKGIRKNCESCTHDYFGIPDTKLTLDFIYNKYLFFPINYLENSITLLKNTKSKKKDISTHNLKKIKNVCIIGWYGTETLGDKAILGGIISNLLQNNVMLKDITIASLNVNYTKLTLHQMNLIDINIVNTYELKSNDKLINNQDVFIFGGGPLCDIEPLVDMYSIFLKSRQNGKLNIIYSCGIGPLKVRRYINTLDKMLSISDIIFFRDRFIINKYQRLLPNIKNSQENYFIDPAVAWIKENYDSAKMIVNKEFILVCIREWPYMYADGLSYENYIEMKKVFEKTIANQIKKYIEKSYRVIFFPMNVDHAGDDDRDYYYYFINAFNLENKVEVVTWDYTPLEALSYFKYAKYVIAMRFHSVVFSITCKTPCLAIDYHYGNGKITGFMNEIGLDHLVISIDDVIENKIDCLNYLSNPDIKSSVNEVSYKLESIVVEMHKYFNDEIDKRR